MLDLPKLLIFLQNISEPGSVILVTYTRLPFALNLATDVGPRDCAVSLIKGLVLPGQEAAQSEGEEAIEEHESGAHPHTHAVVRAVLAWVEPGTKEGPALTDEIQDRNTSTALGVRPLIVENPRKDIANTRENTRSCEKHSGIPGCCCRR